MIATTGGGTGPGEGVGSHRSREALPPDRRLGRERALPVFDWLLRDRAPDPVGEPVLLRDADPPARLDWLRVGRRGVERDGGRRGLGASATVPAPFHRRGGFERPPPPRTPPTRTFPSTPPRAPPRPPPVVLGASHERRRSRRCSCRGDTRLERRRSSRDSTRSRSALRRDRPSRSSPPRSVEGAGG